MDRLEKKLLSMLKRGGGQHLTLRQIQDNLRSGRERGAVVQRLAHLVARGKVVKDENQRFTLASARQRLKGRFELSNERFGFVVPLAPGMDDIYVPAALFGGAIDGDIVEVSYSRKRRGRTSGQIVRIVKRTRREIAGKVIKSSRGIFIDPLSAKILHEIVVVNNEAGPVADGLVVNARIEKVDDHSKQMLVSITEVWGKPDDPEVLTRVIIARFDIPTSFSDAALDEANRVPTRLASEQLSGRTDHRNLVTFTIDGEQAKDFDDAVSIKRLENGFRLWVHIADVSHYVAEGSGIDADAFERGASVYFPGSVIPMLPFALSNEICSLKPNEERLTVTARLDFGAKGRVRSCEVYESVIRSNTRLTYTEVAALLEQRSTKNGESPEFPGFAQDLFAMDDLAQQLTKRRAERGSLDFDLPDPVIILNLQGNPEDVVKEERNPAHRLIEEFMIAANEAVASYLTDAKSPCVYRVHEPPDEDALIGLAKTLKAIGVKKVLTGSDMADRFQHLIEAVRGKRIERLVSYLILRALKIAQYRPENSGHFGLASDCYVHFTSPIRRYPDLMVHRFVKQNLARKKRARSDEDAAQLKEAAYHCSLRERAAMSAERQIVKMRQAQFMADKIGQVFTGIVSGITAKGFFVELDQYFLEGFVPISSLIDDRYSFNEERLCLTGLKSGKTFRIGDALTVGVRSVQVPLGRIDFKLLEDGKDTQNRSKDVSRP